MLAVMGAVLHRKLHRCHGTGTEWPREGEVELCTDKEFLESTFRERGTGARGEVRGRILVSILAMAPLFLVPGSYGLGENSSHGGVGSRNGVGRGR